MALTSSFVQGDSVAASKVQDHPASPSPFAPLVRGTAVAIDPEPSSSNPSQEAATNSENLPNPRALFLQPCSEASVAHVLPQLPSDASFAGVEASSPDLPAATGARDPEFRGQSGQVRAHLIPIDHKESCSLVS